MSRQSFTIIELMLAIGIIGTIAGIVIAAINPGAQLASAADAARRAAAREMGQAITQYEIDNGEITGIPSGAANALPVCRPGAGGQGSCVELNMIAPDYLLEVPQDGSSTEPLLTGYSVYREGPLAQIRSDLLGNVGGNIKLVTDGLVAWWPLDEASGTTATDIVGGFTGNGGGTYSWGEAAPAIVQTNTGSAYFNAGQFTISGTAGSALDIPDAVSVTAWVYREGTANGIILRAGLANDLQYSLFSLADNVRYHWYDGSSFQAVTGPDNSIPLSTWTHIAFTRDDNDFIRLYAGGELVAEQQATFAPPSPLNVSINRTGGQAFVGSIDDLRVYNRELTASEIARIASGNG